MDVAAFLGKHPPFDSLTTTACSGPQCAVGINSGMVGIFVGIMVLLGALWFAWTTFGSKG